MDQGQETKTRTKDDVQKDYNKFCSLAGEAQFKMKACEADIFEFNKQLVLLQKEYNEFLKAETEAQK